MSPDPPLQCLTWWQHVKWTCIFRVRWYRGAKAAPYSTACDVRYVHLSCEEWDLTCTRTQIHMLGIISNHREWIQAALCLWCIQVLAWNLWTSESQALAAELGSISLKLCPSTAYCTCRSPKVPANISENVMEIGNNFSVIQDSSMLMLCCNGFILLDFKFDY